MIKFYTNRDLSKCLGINLAKWKRWSREFLPPDPLGGMQSGYTRQYHPDQAFTVFLGGHLVADLKFSIPEARHIMQDLKSWLSDKGFFFEPNGYVVSDNGVDALIQKYIVFIRREKGTENRFKFVYTIRGIISNEPVLYKDFDVMKKLYVETSLNGGAEKVILEGSMNVVKILNITGLLNVFVNAVGLNPMEYPAIRSE